MRSPAEAVSLAVNMLNIEGLERLDRNAPVVMLNLMRFHARSRDGDGSGWDAYLRSCATPSTAAWQAFCNSRQTSSADRCGLSDAKVG